MQIIRPNIWLPIALLAAMLCARSTLADDAPLFEQEPFDTIKLDDENKNVVLKVQPLDIPNRQLPAKPKPDEELEIRLLDRPRKAYQLSWQHIVEVKLFERMVLDEAEQLTAGGKLDEAYPYYEFLHRRYPKMAEFPASYGKYLLANAGAAYKQQRYEESLAVLWELFDRDPEHKGATTAIQRVVGKLFDGWVADENYVAARGILREASSRLKDRAEPLVGECQSRLQKLATERLAKAKADFQTGRYADARHACQQALAAWPDVDGGAALAAAMQAKYPLIEVGVTASAADGADWAAGRTARLLTRSLAELTRLNGEKGVYDTPLLKGVNINNRRLSLTIKPGIRWPGGTPLTAADVARTLLAAADSHNPTYRSAWAKIVAGITLPEADRVEVELQRPLQRAEPWLELPVWRNDGPLSGLFGLGPYRIASETAQQVHYLSVEDYFAANKSQPKEIIERIYPNSDAALAALRKGDVQIVDHVGPFAAESLKGSAALAFEPYAAPAVHLLVFNRRRPMMNNATFRRAVAHAIDRQGILTDTLSHGAVIPGSHVADTLLGQPPADAASPAVLRFDASTALVLLQVALGEEQSPPAAANAPRAKLEAPSLTLEHPSDDVARTACLAIQRQFQAIGLKLKLREQSPGSAASNPEASDADMFYVEWRPSEQRILPSPLAGEGLGTRGAEGIGGGGSDIAEAFSQLAAATSADQRAIKQADAENLIRELTLAVPLWQLTDYVAYRRDVHGIGRQPITLYQNVEQWRLGSDGE